MAANVASAVSTIQDPMERYALYSAQQQRSLPFVSSLPASLSPDSPATLSAATSPTSHIPLPRQLRPPRVPNYVPAVLRPTDNPSRHRPSKSSSSNSVSCVIATAGCLTPPSSAESSYDGRFSHLSMEESLQKSFKATEGISRVVTDEWSDDVWEQVTGSPTKDHWKPDASSPTCDASVCANSFTLLRRRHHCRRCGNIFCSAHSPFEVPLDQHARFHPHGVSARACDSCWADYRTWQQRRGERSASGSEASGSVTPVPDWRETYDKTESTKKKVKDLFVGSIPRDWNWSTF